MFENILGQDRAVQALVRDLQAGTMPQALLFTGPAWSGKFSAALELARSISCLSANAPWNCTCTRCSAQKFLLSPYVLMAGRRAFAQEIRGAGTSVLADDRDALRMLFIRTIRKLTRRFDPVIWEGETKLAKAIGFVEKLEELIDPIAPNGAWSPSKATSVGRKSLDPGEYLAQIYETADELAALLPHDGISVAMIRRLTYWSHTADASEPKCIILEGASQLNETARNSLLKTLEEPPPNVWFILLAENRQGIMPTILSRVRSYAFIDRGPGDQAVLSRVFRSPEARYASLQDFFFSADAERRNNIERMAKGLWLLLVDAVGVSSELGLQTQRVPSIVDLTALVGPLKGALEEVSRTVLAMARQAFRILDQAEGQNPPCVSAALHTLVTLLNQEARSALTYNRTLAGFIESVHAKVRASRCVDSSKGH